MSIEKHNYDPVDELKRIVLGDNLATMDDLEDFEALAYAVINGAPVSQIVEIDYTTSTGYLGLMSVAEADSPPETNPAVVICLHPGDTDDPFLRLSYDCNNELQDPFMSNNRSDEENIFDGMNILVELLSRAEIEKYDPAEITVIKCIANFLKSIGGIDFETPAIVGPTEHFTDVVRSIIRHNGSAIQHTREIEGNIGDGQEIGIVSATYEPINGKDNVHPEERYPLLQINLTDIEQNILTSYLSLATGERVCDTTLIDEDLKATNEGDISDYDIDVEMKADAIIAVSMSGLNKNALDKLSTAIVAIGLQRS